MSEWKHAQRHPVLAARALLAFEGREHDDDGRPSIRAMTGALLLAEGLDHLRGIRAIAEGWKEGMKRAARSQRRRR